jgi:hypothetical protein
MKRTLLIATLAGLAALSPAIAGESITDAPPEIVIRKLAYACTGATGFVLLHVNPVTGMPWLDIQPAVRKRAMIEKDLIIVETDAGGTMEIWNTDHIFHIWSGTKELKNSGRCSCRSDRQARRETVKAIWCGAIACLVATAATGQDTAVTSFSIRDGETLPLKKITWVTTPCKPVFQKLDGVDVMEDAPELSFTFQPDTVAHATIAGKDCPDPVPGALVSVTSPQDKGHGIDTAGCD